MADVSHLTAPGTKVFQPRSQRSAGAFLLPPRFAEWGHPLIEAGNEPALQPNLGSQSSLRSIERKRKRSWAMILGVVIAGVFRVHILVLLWSLWSDWPKERWIRVSAEAEKVLCALCPTSSAPKPSWMVVRCWPHLLPTNLGWLGPYTDNAIKERISSLFLRVGALPLIVSEHWVKRISGALHQFSQVKKLCWYLLQKDPVHCSGFDYRSICSNMPWTVRGHAVVWSWVRVTAGHHEHPFLLDNSEKNISAPTSLEILSDKSFPGEYSKRLFCLGQV